MERRAISDRAMRERYGWSPPRIVDRSVPTEGILPGLDHPTPPVHQGLTSDHPLYHQWRNPHVWGSLVGRHNPFRAHSFATSEDLPGGWSNYEDLFDSDASRFAHKVQRHLQRTVDKAHPCIRVPGHVLGQVLSEGRLKSQFETGTSRGRLDQDWRGRSEFQHFGYDHPSAREHGFFNAGEDEDERDQPGAEHPAQARPIYGYLAHDPVRNDLAAQYGEHTLVLKKPRIWHRTSASFGDSLSTDQSYGPQPVHQITLHAANPNGFWDDLHYSRNRPSGDSDEEMLRHKLRYWGEHHPDDPGRTYTEAQFHGGVHLNDIHYAILRRDGLGQGDPNWGALKEHLSRASIPWVHIGATAETGWQDRAIHHSSLYREALEYQALLVAAQEGIMEPQVIATRGGGIYLIQTGEHTGRIADTRRGLIWPEQPIASIAARGYWTEPEHPVDAAAVLALVHPA